MQALHIKEHGAHLQLRASEVAAPRPGPGEVLVSVEAAAVNPSDALSAEGRFPHARLPRTLGRDFAGRVVEGPPELVGAAVWGSGGDLGIGRDGTQAEFLVVPRDAVSVRPKNLSAEQAASAGVPFVTAWTALKNGHLQPGECVIVSGAAGAVGWAATEIAAAREARVVALVRNEAAVARIDRKNVVAVTHSERELAAIVREANGGRGADLALNGVGASIFQALLDALADGGRLVFYSVASGKEAPLDLFTLYRRRLHVSGINTVALSATQGARILDQLRPLFESGRLRPHPSIERVPLSEAATAYGRVAQGAPARVVLIPG